MSIISRNTLGREERLRSETEIRAVFSRGKSFLVHPLLVHFLVTEPRDKARVKALFAAPKKKLKKAVQRNYVKRVLRENFRTGKHPLVHLLEEQNRCVHLSVSYIGRENPDFAAIQQAFGKVWERLQEALAENR